MILDQPNSLYAGQQAMLALNGFAAWSWSAFPSVEPAVSGPFCVIASQVYVPGTEIDGVFTAGSVADKVFRPGDAAQHIYGPGSAAGGVCE